MNWFYADRPLPLSLLIRGVWLVLNILIIASIVFVWQQERYLLHHRVNTSVHSLENELNSLLDAANESLHQMQPDIRAANGDLEMIRRVLAGRSYQNKTVLRFAWVDDQDLLRASSGSGINTQPLSLAGRDYLAAARKTPFTTMLSPVVLHIITQKPVLVLAMGITDGTRYLGTLNAVMHLEALSIFIRNHMTGCDCTYRVFSPLEEILYPYTSPAAHPLITVPLSTLRFHVLGDVKPHLLSNLDRLALLWGTIILSSCNLLLWLIWRSLQRRIFSPLSAQFARSPDTSAIDTAEAYLAELSQLSDSYADLSQRLVRSQKQLSRTRELLQQLTQHQQMLSHAASAEIFSCFQAISHYADHLDERIAAQLLQPDHRYDYDDVQELGSNLPRLAHGIRLLMQPATPAHMAAECNPIAMIRTIMMSMRDALERRNLMLAYLPDNALRCHAPEATLHLALECLIFEWIRSSEDEAQLCLVVASDDAGYQLQFCSSHLRLSRTPTATQDFSALLPRMTKTQDIQWMQQLANIFIGRELLKPLHIDCTIAPYEKRGFYIALFIPT